MNIDITQSLKTALWGTVIGNQQLDLDIGCGDGQITVYETVSEKIALISIYTFHFKTFWQTTISDIHTSASMI